MAALVSSALWVLTPGAITKGAPAAFGWFEANGSGRTVVMTVDSTNGFDARSRCDGEVLASAPELSGGKPFALCGVPSALGGQVKPGAKLAVEGYATRFGFHYKTVRPAP